MKLNMSNCTDMDSMVRFIHTRPLGEVMFAHAREVGCTAPTWIGRNKMEMKVEPSYNQVRGVEDTLDGRCRREGDRFVTEEMIKRITERANYEARKVVKSVRANGVKNVKYVVEKMGREGTRDCS